MPCVLPLERDVVFRSVEVRIGWRPLLRRRRFTWRTALWRAAFAVFATTTPTGSAAGGSAFATAQELDVLTHYLELATLLACGFIVPGIELQTAFHEERTAFLAVFP